MQPPRNPSSLVYHGEPGEAQRRCQGGGVLGGTEDGGDRGWQNRGRGCGFVGGRLTPITAQFVAFEVLWLDGKDLTRKPLIERRRILRKLVPVEAPVLYADYNESAVRELYRAVCEMDLEGIVAKRKDGLYTPEATTWVKIKNPAYTQGEGRRELFEKRRGAVA